MKEYLSIEKDIGGLFLKIGIFMLILFGGMMMKGVITGPLTVTFICIPFFMMAFAIFCVGRHYQKKYRILGRTPLVLESDQGWIGGALRGHITVNKENFKRVKSLTLRCVYHTVSNTQDTSYTETVWQSSQAPKIDCVDGNTRLGFDFHIPEDEYPTGQNKNGRGYIRWQVHFSYIDQMTDVTRTWKVPVYENTLSV